MPINAEKLRALIADELADVADERVVLYIRNMLVEPHVLLRTWDYGEPGQQYPCWMVLKTPASKGEIAYSEHGFGPHAPWGLVGSDSNESMGMDSGWFTTFMEAFFESYACVALAIWRVVRVEADGSRTFLTEEGGWDETWGRVMDLRSSNPECRYECGHAVAYGSGVQAKPSPTG